MTVRIGVHPSNHTLFLLSHVPELQEDLDAEFVRYGGGATTAERIGDGRIDVGGTGSTPPITGQAAGVPLVYLATSAPRPSHGKLVVPAGSPITQVADLKGRTISLGIGSWQTQLLAVLLGGAGLRYRDVVPVQTHAGTYEEFAGGRIDAWIAGNPPLDRVIERLGARVLAETADHIGNRSVFFAGRAFAERRRDEAAGVVAALRRADAWIAANLEEAGAIYAEHAADQPQHSVAGADAAEWTAALRSRPWGLEPVSDEFVAEQQRAADLFFEFGIIDRPVEVADALLADPIPLPETVPGTVTRAASDTARSA